MKKLLIILLSVTVVLPLFAVWGEAVEEEEEGGFDPTRRRFEIGFDLGGGLANGLAPFSDIFKKNIEFDLSKIAQSVPEGGTGLNFGPSIDFYVDIKDITIGEGLWNFGFIIGVDGNVNLNITKSLFTLISEGNINNHDSSGSIGASGGIFTEIGLTSSAKYEVAGRTLRVGVKPTIFTPAVYIPSSSKITYNMSSTNDKGEEGIFITTGGGLEIYTPTSIASLDDSDIGGGSPDPFEPSRFIIGPSGFDLSLEGEYYNIIPFLDAGIRISNIPFAPATLKNLMTMNMSEFNIGVTGEQLLSGSGDEQETPEIDFTKEYTLSEKQVFRPFRLDLFARYRPLKSNWLIIKPNLGFSVNVNKGDEKGYFNAGLEVRTNIIKVFTFYVSSSYREELWRQKAGLGINVRAFELDLEGSLMDQTFDGCFMGRGFDFNVGLRFGW